MPDRPRLAPAVALTRNAVGEALPRIPAADGVEALVALSGGPDSLALARAAAFVAPRAGRRIGAVIVDHGLVPLSAAIAATAADQARTLGLSPVLVRRVVVGAAGGPEAAAREARYGALHAALAETGASRLLLGHTLDDQAETVLLGLARGSGPDAVGGMRPDAPPLLRPLLGLRRQTVHASLDGSGLEPWIDPMNKEHAYARVRVRQGVLPIFEAEVGPGIAEALARTASQVREDAEALDAIAEELLPELAELAEGGIALPVPALAANPPALLQRLIRLAVEGEFGRTLTRAHTLAVARLVTDWHGQGPIDLPGITVMRRAGRLEFAAR